MDREPAVAGRFYPGDAARLARDVAEMLGVAASTGPALGVLAPHAGYVYSGLTAAHVYARLDVPRAVVVLAPNHTGLGRARSGGSVYARGGLRTPVGTVPVDEALATVDLAGRRVLLIVPDLTRTAPIPPEDRTEPLRSPPVTDTALILPPA